MTRRAGHGLREHAPGQVEHTRGQIARFADGIRKRGADQRLRLFLDHRQQAVPHELIVDLSQRAVRFIHHDRPLFFSNTMGCVTVVVTVR